MTFVLERIGRIKSAQIDIKPMTLFIGKNDSGKTYCASAIWSTAKFILGQRNNDKLAKISEVQNYIEKANLQSDREFRYKFSAGAIRSIQKIVQTELSNSTQSILSDAIGHKGFEKSKIHFTQLTDNIEMSIRAVIKKEPKIEQIEFDLANDSESTQPSTLDLDTYSIEYEFYVGEERVRALSVDEADPDFALHILHREALGDLAGHAYFGNKWKIYRNTVYLPAARTGIMLAIDYFVSGTMQRYAATAKQKIEKTSSLPAPLRDFASRITDPYMSRRSSEFLHKILPGSYVATKKRGEFEYKTKELESPIPLASTSSLVTELAGFALMGAYMEIGDRLVIFEEPEAHLHLEAQREIAKALVSLANGGKHLIITTHSDTFLQQINNLITLNDHPQKAELLKKFNIDQGETLNRNDVAAYDFSCVNGETEVKTLECTKTGFIAQSLNEVLLKLTNETIEINIGLEEQ